MKDKIKAFTLLVSLIIVIYIIFRILQPSRFGSVQSMFILLQQCLLPSVAACGFYFILTMGMFDFSLGAMVVLSAIVGGILSRDFGMAGLLFGGVAVGTLAGFVNGIVFIKLKIPSIIVTIGLCIIYECIGIFVCGGKVLTLGADVRMLGKAPYNIIVSLATCVIAYVILKYTRIGVYCNAIGSNETLAKNMGINIQKYKVIGFVLCGLFVGIMSALTISYGSSIKPASGMSSMSRNFTPIMGCFIGLALKKYIPPVISIVLGEFLITMLVSGLMTNGIDVTLQDVIIGLTLLIVVCVSTVTGRREVVK